MALIHLEMAETWFDLEINGLRMFGKEAEWMVVVQHANWQKSVNTKPQESFKKEGMAIFWICSLCDLPPQRNLSKCLCRQILWKQKHRETGWAFS